MAERDREEESGLVELVEVQTGLRIDSLANNMTNPSQDVSLGHSDLNEPHSKRMRLGVDVDDIQHYFTDSSIKTMLHDLGTSLTLRLGEIDNKIHSLDSRLVAVETKLDEVLNTVNIINLNTDIDPDLLTTGKSGGGGRKSGVVIVGLPEGKRGESFSHKHLCGSNYGRNVTLITLNSEDDYPDGSWIGDENNPEMRVRVPIPPSTLLHINTNCRSAEKMALTLLDYLFDRETQAVSNLSGMGRYNKKQLDPLFVYAIRCHVVHHFGITDNDWHRIKQNLDSKCRTAFRRKQHGLRMAVKSFRGRDSAVTVDDMNGLLVDGVGVEDTSLCIDHVTDDNSASSVSDVASTFHPDQKFPKQSGEIQILHATPEQLSQLRQAQHIEILQGDDVLGHLQQGQMSISLVSPDQIHIQAIKTESGDIVHLDAGSIVPISASALSGQLTGEVVGVHDTLAQLD